MNQLEIKTKFNYIDGELYWAETTGCRKAGSLAGSSSTSKGKVIKLNYKIYQVSRLIYMYHYGVFPDLCVHIDGDIFNNRIENLTSKTRSEINVCRVYHSEKNPSKGVHLKNRVYTANISKDCHRYHLGTFKTLKEAQDARREAYNQLYKQNFKVSIRYLYIPTIQLLL